MLPLDSDMVLLGTATVSAIAAGATMAWSALEVMRSKKFAAACQHNAQIDRHAIEMALNEFSRMTTRLSTDIDALKATTKLHSKSISGASVDAIESQKKLAALSSRVDAISCDLELAFGRLNVFNLDEKADRISRLESSMESSYRDLAANTTQHRTWLSRLDATLKDLNTLAANSSDDLSAVENRVTDLHDRLCQLNGEVSGEINALRADVNASSEVIAKLKDRVDDNDDEDNTVVSLSDCIRRHDLLIDGLDRRIEGLRKAISTTAEQIESLRSKIGGYRGLEAESMDQLSRIGAKVSEIDSSVELIGSSLGSRIHAIESKVSTLDNIAAQVVPGLEKRIEEVRADLQGQVDSAAADIVEIRG